MLAAVRGNQAIATELLQAKAQPNASNNNENTALHYAAGNGCQAVADMPFKAKADPTAVDNDGDTAAKIAEQRGHPKLVQRLREAEASH